MREYVVQQRELLERLDLERLEPPGQAPQLQHLRNWEGVTLYHPPTIDSSMVRFWCYACPLLGIRLSNSSDMMRQECAQSSWRSRPCKTRTSPLRGCTSGSKTRCMHERLESRGRFLHHQGRRSCRGAARAARGGPEAWRRAARAS